MHVHKSVCTSYTKYVYLLVLFNRNIFKKPRSTLVTRPKLSQASTAVGCNAWEDRERRESGRNLNILMVRVRVKVRVEVRVRGVVPVPAGTGPSRLE